MQWRDRPNARKGTLGERIVDRWLLDQDFIPYVPCAEGAHPFDRLCASRDKRTIFIADAKAKPARRMYPDTGINIRHYEEYSHIRKTYKIPVFIFFVDEQARRIYGNWLSILEKEQEVLDVARERLLKYPMKSNGIIYFPLIAMRQICELSEQDCTELKKLASSDFQEA